jgi:hypothetical protein
MKINIFNSKRIFQIGVLAIFLLSWLSSANATILCECEEGHITVENIYTGYCNLDLNHDHSNQGHSDLTCSCDDSSINLNIVSYSSEIDYDFDFEPQKTFKIDNSINQIGILKQDYILLYDLNVRRKLDTRDKVLNTVILLI